MKRRKKDTGDGGWGRWILTLSDLLTLLLCFLILEYSMLEISVGELEKVALQTADQPPPDAAILPTEEELLTEVGDGDSSGKPIFAGEGISIKREKKGPLVVTLRGASFPSSGRELSLAGATMLRRLGATLVGKPISVEVRGHTDDQPFSLGSAIRSNWELSGLRAASVVRQLVESGVEPERITAVAYGDSSPIANNATVAGRYQNRRVELVIREKQ